MEEKIYEETQRHRKCKKKEDKEGKKHTQKRSNVFKTQKHDCLDKYFTTYIGD
jgi:hypothetical protein